MVVLFVAAVVDSVSLSARVLRVAAVVAAADGHWFLRISSSSTIQNGMVVVVTNPVVLPFYHHLVASLVGKRVYMYIYIYNIYIYINCIKQSTTTIVL